MGVYLKDVNFYGRFQQGWKFPRLNSEVRILAEKKKSLLRYVCCVYVDLVNWLLWKQLTGKRSFQAFSFSCGDYLLHGSQAMLSSFALSYE